MLLGCVAVVLATILWGCQGGTSRIIRKPVAELPAATELPDPFLFADGSRVRTPADWPRRREEILQLLQLYQYGHLPPATPPGSVTVKPAPDYELPRRSGSNADQPPATRPSLVIPAGAKQEKLLLTVRAPAMRQPVQFHVVLTLPAGSQPRPVIVRGDLCWGPVKSEILAEIMNRGYVLVDFDRTEIVPDSAGPRDVGAYAAFAEGDFAGLAAWAWGYHRTIDYLLTRGDVDAARIIATGHSRGGKTALLAGATDTRIALTVPNGSGCGGAGCYRVQGEKSETIEDIVQKFPYWFHADFGQFIGQVQRLPFDQHSLKAAVAPRALLCTEALGDLWANPHGTQITNLAAAEVYRFLGVEDRIGLHFREGEHAQKLEDWKALLDFADQMFFGKPAKRRFNELPFPASRPWSWQTPPGR